MTAEAKLRTLAQQDENLQAFFFTDDQIRWFDRQLPPGYLVAGRSCAWVTRVSTIPLYTHGTRNRQAINRMVQIRFQIDVADYDATTAKAAAQAIIEWLSTIDLSSTAQFDSPTTSPTRHPNFLLNQRSSLLAQLKQNANVETLDVRITNLEE